MDVLKRDRAVNSAITRLRNAESFEDVLRSLWLGGESEGYHIGSRAGYVAGYDKGYATGYKNGQGES